MANPTGLTRTDLQKFLPDQRSVKAFEQLFDLIPSEFTRIDGDVTNVSNEITIIQQELNSAVVSVAADYQMVGDFPNVVVTVTGLTLTLPKCSTDFIGRRWSVHLPISGTVSIVTTSGDTIPTPDNASETTIVLNRRGSTVDFLCNSTTTWSFV